jgi:hypothetical protein
MDLYTTDAKRALVQHVLMQHSDSRTPQHINVLQRLTIAFTFFQSLPPHVHLELCRYMTFKTFRKSAVVIKEGDNADCMQAQPPPPSPSFTPPFPKPRLPLPSGTSYSQASLQFCTLWQPPTQPTLQPPAATRRCTFHRRTFR